MTFEPLMMVCERARSQLLSFKRQIDAGDPLCPLAVRPSYLLLSALDSCESLLAQVIALRWRSWNASIRVQRLALAQQRRP